MTHVRQANQADRTQLAATHIRAAAAEAGLLNDHATKPSAAPSANTDFWTIWSDAGPTSARPKAELLSAIVAG